MSTATIDRTMILSPVPATAIRPRVAQRPAARHGEVRLTRRGRLVVFVVCVAAVAAFGLFLSAGSVASEQSGTPERTEVIVVQPGQTLWGIASEVTHGSDVRSMVEHLQHINTLDGGMVRAGQRLLVPVE